MTAANMQAHMPCFVSQWFDDCIHLCLVWCGELMIAHTHAFQADSPAVDMRLVTVHGTDHADSHFCLLSDVACMISQFVYPG